MLHVKEENALEQALHMNIDTPVEVPTGKIEDLTPRPTKQDEVRRSPLRKAFERSQKVEINGLLDVGCFKVVVDEKYVRKARKVVGLGFDGCTRTRATNTETV